MISAGWTVAIGIPKAAVIAELLNSLAFITMAACCTDMARVEFPLSPPGRSSDADGLRASEAEHTVEDIDGDGHLGGLSFVGVGTQGIADDLLVSTDLRLDQSAQIVLSGRLPTRSPLRGDIQDVTVAASERCRRYR